jgi:regulatory protein
MKDLSPVQVREKIKRYCAYQERCHSEVRNKLFALKIPRDEADRIVVELIEEGFLNEERFSKSFAGGKFRIKKWGKLKIINELEARGISKNCIKTGLKEIDDRDYEKTLRNILESKSDEVKTDNMYVRRDKLSKFAIGKGYEPEIVWMIVKEMFPDQR